MLQDWTRAERRFTWPCPPCFQSLKRPTAHVELAVAVRAVHGRERALLQARGRHDHLEHRPGRVLARQRAVHERRHGIAHELEPLLAAEVAGEPVERKGGARGHRQHVAVARIHHDHRPGTPGHRALRHLLNAPVDRGDDLGARVGLLAPHDLHLPAEGVHLDALAAVSAAQVLVEQALEPGSARSCRPAGSRPCFICSSLTSRT